MLSRISRRSLNLSLAELDRAMEHAIIGRPSTSGVHVNETVARSLTAVFCAERILSETVAQVPLDLLARGPDGKRQTNVVHPLRKVLRKKPNPWQTTFEWRRMMQGHAGVRGNGFSEIIRDSDGYPKLLIPRHPDKIKAVGLGDLGVGYGHIMPDGKIRPIPPGDMLHFRGPSSDGITGDSLVTMFRNVIGLALATEEHGARLFSNGAQVPFAIRHPQGVSDKAYERLKESLAEEHGGVSNAHRPLFLEEGMDVTRLGLTGVDSQFIESRHFHILEFARIFRIPPHMLSDLSRATFSNIEEMALEFVTYTMLPWFVMWEQRMDVDLLSEDDQDEYYTKFNLNGLLRADMKTRYESYAIGKQWGWLNSNRILELEDMDPIDGIAGEKYLEPLNMKDASKEDDPTTEPEPKAMARLLQVRLRKAHQEIFRDAAGRMIRKEVAALRKGIGKAEEFYAAHAQTVVRCMYPALSTHAQAFVAASLMWDSVDMRSLEVFIAKHAETITADYIASHREALKQAAGPEQVASLLDEWEIAGPIEVALRESANLTTALTEWLTQRVNA